MYKTRATYIQRRIEAGNWEFKTKPGPSPKRLRKARYKRRKKIAKKTKHLVVGSKVKGRVVKILKYGAVLKITGISCFLHISEISNEWVDHHEWMDHPSKFLSLHRPVDVWIVSKKIDKQGGLSIKLTMKGPPTPEVSKKYRLKQRKD